MTNLTKLFTREHSLFYFYIWHESDKKGIKKWIKLNLENDLFLREGKDNKVSVWYDLSYGTNKKGALYSQTAKLLNNNTKLFPKLKAQFLKYWKLREPPLHEKRSINSIKELKKLYRLHEKNWETMALIVNIPEIPEVPEKIKHEALKLRTKTQEYSDRTDEGYLEFMEKHYPEYNHIKYVLLPKEIFQLQKRNFTKEEVNDFKKRLNGYFMLGGKLFLIEKLASVLNMKNLVLEKENITSELKGSSASKGFVKGKVRTILYKSQISELNEGEILVTEMTSPEFVPAIKKASAIVTDEGGITCHAAIVSRELGIPCVIGTKIATQVLHDGDLVEVDANKGIVKVLEKAK